ncbi:hypothetical protein MD484_g5052, partial [Candolleomyces efflorescens]
MPWFWPPEGPESLPSRLFTSTSHLLASTGEGLSQWNLASERFLALVLEAARPPIVSSRPELANALCYLAETLRVANLGALVPCNVVQETIYAPTQTAPLSDTPTITPFLDFIAPQSLLLEYGTPPEFMHIAVNPYSLILVWLAGVISVFAFSTGGLSRFKRIVQEGLPRTESLAGQAFKILLSTFYYSLPPIIIITYAAGLLALIDTIMVAQVILLWTIMPAHQNLRYLVTPAPSRHTWFDGVAESLLSPGDDLFAACCPAIFALCIATLLFFWNRSREPCRDERLSKFEPVVDRDIKKHVYIYSGGGVFEPYEVTEYDAC